MMMSCLWLQYDDDYDDYNDSPGTNDMIVMINNFAFD